LKIDTVTGHTWFLDAADSWRPSPDSPCTETAVEARIRTVVERAVEPLIAGIKVYNPKTQQFDKLGGAEARQRIETIVQEALGTYGTLQRDPLGILEPQNEKK